MFWNSLAVARKPPNHRLASPFMPRIHCAFVNPIPSGDTRYWCKNECWVLTALSRSWKHIKPDCFHSLNASICEQPQNTAYSPHTELTYDQYGMCFEKADQNKCSYFTTFYQNTKISIRIKSSNSQLNHSLAYVHS